MKPRLHFERYYRAVVGFFIRFGFPLEDAQDLAQTVFVRVCQGMESNRGEGPWSFLQTTARRTALNELRRRSTQKRLAPEVPLDGNPSVAGSLASNSSTPEDELLLREKLEAAIEGLSGITRNCVLLQMNGLSYREIADTLGITVDAVKARLKTARKLLRDKLGDDLEGLD